MAGPRLIRPLSLPVETISNIMLYASDDESSDLMTIRNANLVCSAWHFAVRPLIYRSIRLRPYTLNRFEALMKDLPVVAYWAEIVEIYRFRPWNGGDPFTLEMLRKWEQLARVLMAPGLMKNVNKVVFCDCIFPHPTCYETKGIEPITEFWSGFRNMQTKSLFVEYVTLPVDCFKKAILTVPGLTYLYVIRSRLLGGNDRSLNVNGGDDSDDDDSDYDKDYDDSDDDSEEEEEEEPQAGDNNDATENGGGQRPKRSMITYLCVSDLNRLRDILSASSISKLEYVDVDGMCVRDRPSRPDPNTRWFMRHLGENLHTLRVRLLPEEDENATFGWGDISHLTALHTVELRPINHDAVPDLLDEFSGTRLRRIDLPIQFDSLDQFKPGDYDELNEVLASFDPSIFGFVKFYYLGRLSWAEADKRVRDVVKYPFWVGKGVVTKIPKAMYPFSTSYGGLRKINYGLRTWNRLVGPDDARPKPTTVRALEDTRIPRKKTIAALY